MFAEERERERARRDESKGELALPGPIALDADHKMICFIGDILAGQ